MFSSPVPMRVIVSRDLESLPLTDAVNQRERLLQVLGAASGLTDVAVHLCPATDRPRRSWDPAPWRADRRESPPEHKPELNCARPSAYAWNASSDVVVTCSVRNVELLDRGQRLPQLRAHPRGGRGHGPEHVLLVFGLHLLAGQRLPRLAIGGLERDGVGLAQARDGAADHRLLAFPLADLARDLVGDAFPGGAAHQAEILAHLLVAQDLQERRLLKLHGQGFPQRARQTPGRRWCW